MDSNGEQKPYSDVYEIIPNLSIQEIAKRLSISIEDAGALVKESKRGN